MQRRGPQGTEFWRSWNAKLKYTNEESSKSRWQNGVICLVNMFAPGVCSFCWCQQNISHSLEKIFTCIWKIVFSYFRKCNGLFDSNIPLARYQPLNIQSFIIFLLTQQFFDNITLGISQMVTPRPINHTIFWKKSKRSFSCT